MSGAKNHTQVDGAMILSEAELQQCVRDARAEQPPVEADLTAFFRNPNAQVLTPEEITARVKAAQGSQP